MARILVNYIYNKAKDEYKILDPDCVYADQQVSVLETEDEIKRPLIVPIRGMLTVVDRDRFEQVHKKFYLVADEKGNVMENPNGTERWLPKDTDVSKLKVVNGQLVMVQDDLTQQEQKPEQEKEQKETPKEETKPTSKKRKSN